MLLIQVNCGIFIIIPIYWCIVTSFKHSAEITSSVVTYWPKQFTVENYINAWLQSGFEIYFRNSLFISVIGVVFIVVISVLSGYALARFKFKGKNVYMLILLVCIASSAVLYYPFFKVADNQAYEEEQAYAAEHAA